MREVRGRLLPDKEFRELFPLLNTLCGDYTKWVEKKAQAVFVCEFGCEIARGRVYYKKSWGPGALDAYRLCGRCMDRMLLLVLASDGGTAKIANWVERKRFDRKRAAVEKLRGTNTKGRGE